MEYENSRIAEFLSEHWQLFSEFCAGNGDDPEDIYSAVSSED